MSWFKQPDEVKDYTVDFTDVLPTGQTITSSSTVAAYDSGGHDVSSTLISSVSTTTTTVTAIIMAGTTANRYKIVVSGVTASETFEYTEYLDVLTL